MLEKQEKYDNLFGLIFWLHLGLEILALGAPFLFSWWIILAAIIFLSIQYYFFGGCVLNKWQFGTAKDVTFLYPYCQLVGLDVKLPTLKFFMRVVLPAIIFGLAVLWQIVLGKNTLLF